MKCCEDCSEYYPGLPPQKGCDACFNILKEENDFLEAMNARTEEARVAHLETSEKLEAEVKRLREALEFYADVKNWLFSNEYGSPSIRTEIRGDHDHHLGCSGKRARQALAEDVDTDQVPAGISWKKVPRECEAYFQDGSIFVGALQVKNHRTGSRQWEIYTLQVSADENHVHLYTYTEDGRGDSFSGWEFEDFEYYIVLTGEIKVHKEVKGEKHEQDDYSENRI